MAEKSDRAQREEKILKFWQENEIFKKTLEKPASKGDFVFYEGPPTANGRPGIHHVEARAFKDAIPRYKTMQGFHVRRKAGWDTHGLPVELEVEKTLGLKSKKEIEEYGVAKFNEECKKSVWKYVDEWRRFSDRIGYWVDLDNPYVTYYNSYIESVWSILAEVEKKGLLYKDYKVVPWCPRCGTALSSHELAQGYKDVKELSVYVKFDVVGRKNTYLLAWTTTPWTLPGNIALAVGKDVEYVEVKVGSENFLLAKSRLEILEGEYEITRNLRGRDLVGLEYESLYPFVREKNPENIENAYKVYSADFVTTEDGTGIVHTAVMYGQDDFELGQKVGLPKIHLVSETGHFLSGTGFLEGKFVKSEETDVEIIKDLAHRNLLLKKEKHEHSYPHCWRCKTPLIYYARDSWYIRMSELRDKLVKENQKINWEPDYIKEGRFGEWLREVKDWAISRERYWGTPLPVWLNASGDKRIVANSIEALRKYGKKSGNKYFVMRHGQAENNIKRVVSTSDEDLHDLTQAGREQARETAESLKKEGINLIITSPFLRTRETAKIVAEALSLSSEDIVVDERLREFQAGDFDTKSEDELHSFFEKNDLFQTPCPGGESFSDTKRRLGEAMNDLEKTYEDRNILIITHKVCAWLLVSATERLDKKQTNELDIYLDNGAVIKIDAPTLPHNTDYELDLHKPYIDEIVLTKDGEDYFRTKEVLDVWFDSGAMPFAQHSEERLNLGNKERFDLAGKYPADFISEALDQTRGWFYTLHAIGVLLGEGLAYKNVICLGLLLDKEGKKMSKSVGNVVDPWEMADKYGVDAMRFWMYSVNQPGESKNFDEKNLDEINRRLFNMLDNVHSFLELYVDGERSDLKNSERSDLKEPTNVLDKWILVRLYELIELVTRRVDEYKLLEPTRAMREFVDDLSTWYLRRSRERIKNGDQEAITTLKFVLMEFSKTLAPFAPFSAEELYQKLRQENDPESAHLCDWPSPEGRTLNIDSQDSILESMEEVRKLISLALEQRQRANIKVRQPLRKLKVRNPKLGEEYLELIRDEVNVKEIIQDSEISLDVELDTEVTPELAEEGAVRDVIRSIQDWRKEQGLNPRDSVEYTIPEDKKDIFLRNRSEIENSTNVKLVENLSVRQVG